MAASSNNKSPLERMNENLYASKPRATSGTSSSQNIRTGAPTRQTGWQHEEKVERQHAQKVAPSVLFLGGALIFFLIAAGVAAFLLLTGGTSVSSDKVDIKVNEGAPTAISSGDTVPLLIEITNHNPTTLTKLSFSVNFPEGTYDPDQAGQLLTHATVAIDSLAPGETVRRTVRARLFGVQNQQLSLPLTLEYRTQGSSAVFVKKDTYVVTVSTSPIALEVQSISEVSGGQEFTVVVTARSNASSDIPNVAVQASYPFGFTARDTAPMGDSNGRFVLGTLSSGQSKEITIHGSVSGTEGDEKVLRFAVGTFDPSSKFVSYIEKTASVFLTKPFLNVSLSLNQSEESTITASAGSEISGTISIGNTLSDPIQNGSVLIKLKGNVVDTGSIAVTNGFYNSSDQTIRFDKENIPGLANLKPGDAVNGMFTFRLKNASSIATISNPSEVLAVSATGNRSSAGNVSETLSSTLTRTIQIESALHLTARTTHSTGPFANTGPVPPTANSETTYTVFLQVANGTNAIADGKVTAKLPSYIRFTGSTNPAGAIAYDDSSRTVTWTIGDINANSSVLGAFQVALLPSTSQRGTSPLVATGIAFTGHDRYTGKDSVTSASNVTTETTADAGYTSTTSQVQ